MNFLIKKLFYVIAFLFIVFIIFIPDDPFDSFFIIFFLIFTFIVVSILFNFGKQMKLKKQFKNMKESNSKVNDSTNIKQGLKEGVIKDRYTDLKGDKMFFVVEVLDKKFNSTFLVKLSKED